MPLEMTRAIIKAAFEGKLGTEEYISDPIFHFRVPTRCPKVPSEVLVPSLAWKDRNAYDVAAQKLAQLFKKNFEQYRDQTSPEWISAGPR